MKIITTIWKEEPYTETVEQISDGSMKITEITINKSKIVEDGDKDVFKPVKVPKRTRATSGMIVDVSGLMWAEKVSKIKSVMVSEGVEVETIKFLKSVCRKESGHSPDNFIVAVKFDSETIYEANGKFSVKRVLEKL